MEVEAERVSTTSDSKRSDGGFLSRGDGPAQAVLHANAQAMSLRKAAETQEQLGEINDRVEKVLHENYKAYKTLSLVHSAWNFVIVHLA